MRLRAAPIEAQRKHLSGCKFGRNALSMQFVLSGFKAASRLTLRAGSPPSEGSASGRDADSGWGLSESELS